MCPASEHHGSPVAEVSPGYKRKGADPSWGKVWDHPLPSLAPNGFQAHRLLCLQNLIQVSGCGEGIREKRQWEEKKDILDSKLLEPAPMG